MTKVQCIPAAEGRLEKVTTRNAESHVDTTHTDSQQQVLQALVCHHYPY